MSGIGPAMDDVVPVATQPATTQQPVQPQPATARTSVPSQPTSATVPASEAATATAPVSSTDAASATSAQPAPRTQADAPATTGRAVSFPVRPATTAQVAARPATPAAVDAGSIGGAVFSLLLIIGLILGLGWLAKRMPGMKRSANAAQLKVVASVALGPRERAVVLDVGGQHLLVGVGQGGVRTLHTLEHPLPVVESTAPSPFAQVLAQHFGKKS